MSLKGSTSYYHAHLVLTEATEPHKYPWRVWDFYLPARVCTVVTGCRRWLCGCEPPSCRVNQSKQPRAGREVIVSRKRFEKRRCRLLLLRGGSRPVYLPLALTVCMCFSWRNILEALLCGVHTHTRNEKCSRSSTHFIEWFHSSKLPMCLFPPVKGKGGASWRGDSQTRSPGGCCPNGLSCCCLEGRSLTGKRPWSGQPLRKGLPASSIWLLRDFQYFQTK